MRTFKLAVVLLVDHPALVQLSVLGDTLYSSWLGKLQTEIRNVILPTIVVSGPDVKIPDTEYDSEILHVPAPDFKAKDVFQALNQQRQKLLKVMDDVEADSCLFFRPAFPFLSANRVEACAHAFMEKNLDFISVGREANVLVGSNPGAIHRHRTFTTSLFGIRRSALIGDNQETLKVGKSDILVIPPVELLNVCSDNDREMISKLHD